MNDFKLYKRIGMCEARPYVPGEDLTGISVADNDTPIKGGMIARNMNDYADQWYINPRYFEANFELA